MSRYILGLIISGILTTSTSTVQEPVSTCQDIDTNACALFQKAKPDLCSDPTFSQGSCIRFCGNCPISCYTCPRPVRSIFNCTTQLCSNNQTCMIKHFTDNDGSEEFVMRCEDKKLCEGLLHGFYTVPVGRRHLQSSKSRQQEKRDVSLSLSCCNTDFCNRPASMTTATVTSISMTTATVTPTSMTTTTVTPTSMTTTMVTSPGPFPHGCNRDIVFAIDDSGSVGPTNFRHALDFVKQIVNQLQIGPTKAQTALLSYSTHAQVGWYLNSYSTKQQVLNATDHVPYHAGVTHTNEALGLVRTQVLTQAHGDRALAKNVVIVLTDGQSNDRTATIKEAQKLHMISDDIISIAIGAGINAQVISAIATDNHHVFDIRSYSALNTILNNILQIVCNA